MKKIKMVWGIIKFTVDSGVKILTDSMIKEAQTYKEEKDAYESKKIAISTIEQDEKRLSLRGFGVAEIVSSYYRQKITKEFWSKTLLDSRSPLYPFLKLTLTISIALKSLLN